MNEVGYRDGLAGLREQLAEKRAHVADLAARLTPLRRATLTHDEVAGLDDAVVRIEKLGDADAASLTEAAMHLDRLIELFPAVIALSAERMSIALGPPAGVAVRGNGDRINQLAADVAQRIGREPLWDGGRVHFDIEDEGVPIRLSAAVKVTESKMRLVDSLSAAASVKVPSALPVINVTRATSGDELLAYVFHQHRDVEVGDLAFDAKFVVRGSAAVARAVLTPDVRAGMHALAKLGVTLSLCNGAAYVTWSSKKIVAAMVLRDDAIAVVKGIRRAIEREAR